MRGTVMVMTLALVLPAAGCGGADTDTHAAADDTAAVHDAAAAPGAGAAAHGEVAADDHGAAGEGAPLLAIMQRLGSEMTSLTHALMTDDSARVAASAHAIAQHAPIADIERVRHELGADMAEFERLDGSVHEALVQLHDAAAAGRTDDVLTRLNEAQRGCVACHARFRERLRTAPTS